MADKSPPQLDFFLLVAVGSAAVARPDYAAVARACSRSWNWLVHCVSPVRTTTGDHQELIHECVVSLV